MFSVLLELLDIDITGVTVDSGYSKSSSPGMLMVISSSATPSDTVAGTTDIARMTRRTSPVAVLTFMHTVYCGYISK